LVSEIRAEIQEG